jgi:uncharacterized membrane protein
MLRRGLLLSLALACTASVVAQDAAPETETTDAVSASQPAPTASDGGTARREPAVTSTQTRTADTPADTTRREEDDGLVATYLRPAVIVVGLIGILVLAACVLLLTRTFVDATKDERVGIESNWGGFGGASSGWGLSRPLSLLVAMVLLASFMYLTLDAVLRAVGVRANDVTPTEQARNDPTEELKGSKTPPAE